MCAAIQFQVCTYIFTWSCEVQIPTFIVFVLKNWNWQWHRLTLVSSYNILSRDRQDARAINSTTPPNWYLRDPCGISVVLTKPTTHYATFIVAISDITRALKQENGTHSIPGIRLPLSRSPADNYTRPATVCIFLPDNEIVLGDTTGMRLLKQHNAISTEFTIKLTSPFSKHPRENIRTELQW